MQAQRNLINRRPLPTKRGLGRQRLREGRFPEPRNCPLGEHLSVSSRIPRAAPRRAEAGLTALPALPSAGRCCPPARLPGTFLPSPAEVWAAREGTPRWGAGARQQRPGRENRNAGPVPPGHPRQRPGDAPSDTPQRPTRPLPRTVAGDSSQHPNVRVPAPGSELPAPSSLATPGRSLGPRAGPERDTPGHGRVRRRGPACAKPREGRQGH